MAEQSLTEKAGMMFERRCVGAYDYLRSTWELMRGLATIDLKFGDESARRADAFLSGLSQSDRREVEPLVKVFGFAEIYSAHDEKHFVLMWQRALRFANEFYGADAVDFALKMIANERENAGH